MENETTAPTQNQEDSMYHGDVNFNTSSQPVVPPTPKRSPISTIINVLIILMIGVLAVAGVVYYNDNIKNKDSESSSISVISDEEVGDNSEVKGDEDEKDNDGESTENKDSNEGATGTTKGGDVLGTTTIVKVEKDVNDPSNWDIVRITSHGITFKHPKMNYTCCGIQGPITGNPGQVIVLADTSTVTEGTNKPFNGIAMYMLYSDNGMNLNDYINGEKDALLNKYEDVLGTRGVNPSEQDVSISGKHAKLLKGYAYWGDVYYLQLDDKHILYITKTEQSDGSFDTNFNKILETLQFSY